MPDASVEVRQRNWRLSETSGKRGFELEVPQSNLSWSFNMKLTKLLISSASAFAIVGTIGFAVAQTSTSPGAADAGANLQASPNAPPGTIRQGNTTPAMNSTRPMTNADGSMNSDGSMTGTGAMGNANSGTTVERVAQADRN
jgi:hypothetical protein